MRVLSLLLSLVCGLAYSWWASQPVWTVSGYHQITYVGHSDERGEFVTLTKSHDQWHFETRNLRTGQLLKQVPVEMPGLFHYVLNYENIKLNHDGHDVASFQCEKDHTSRDTKTLVFNLRTGKMIVPKEVGEVKNIPSTTFGSRYVLCQEQHILLLDERLHSLRKVQMESPVRDVRFLHDGELIVCMIEGGLFVVRWIDGEILHFLQLPNRKNYINVLRNDCMC